MGWPGHVARMGERRGAYRVLVSLRERNHLEDQGVEGSSGSLMGGLDGIYLAHSRDRWRSVVDAVMNFRVPNSAGNFLTGSAGVMFPLVIQGPTWDEAGRNCFCWDTCAPWLR
jgi:hypothetical protein